MSSLDLGLEDLASASWFCSRPWPRGSVLNLGLEDLALALASWFWPRPKSFGLGLDVLASFTITDYSIIPQCHMHKCTLQTETLEGTSTSAPTPLHISMERTPVLSIRIDANEWRRPLHFPVSGKDFAFAFNCTTY